MMKFAAVFLALGGWAFSPGAGAEPIQALKAKVKRPTEVLVLATEHLSRIEAVTPAHLDGLHAALRRFAPQAVVVEAMSAPTIEAMLASRDDYEEVLQDFVGPQFLQLADNSRRELGVSAAQARQQLDTCQPLPLAEAAPLARCLKLAAAAHDKAWFGYLAWQYHRRHGAVPLPGVLGEQVAKIGASRGENYLIAARLADELGLVRLHGMDYYPSRDLYGPVYDALGPSIEKSAAAAAFGNQARMIVETRRLSELGVRECDLLPLLRWTNSPEYARLVVDEEWRLFVDRDLEPKPALARLALWDVRNLEMVANVLRVASRHPGGRILVTVGASHKVFLDDYLQRSIGIRLRQLEEFVEP